MVENSSPQTSTPRWIKIALILSLAINLGVVGILGGAALRAPEARRNNVEAPEGVAMLARAMPQSHQRELRENLRTQRDELRSDRQELKNLRGRFITSLRAEPFDINAVRDVFASQRTVLDQLTASGHDSVIDQIEKMTPQERALYIRRLLAGHRPPSNNEQSPKR
ncbi:MAG: periplasmic heavy metal sensor [Paracoccaceae bacterium]